MGHIYNPQSVLDHGVCLLQLLSPFGCGIRFITLLWQTHKQHDFQSEIMNNMISHLKHSVLEHYVSLLPFLVAHHHLTKIILIGIIFISQILQFSLVIGILRRVPAQGDILWDTRLNFLIQIISRDRLATRKIL